MNIQHTDQRVSQLITLQKATITRAKTKGKRAEADRSLVHRVGWCEASLELTNKPRAPKQQEHKNKPKYMPDKLTKSHVRYKPIKAIATHSLLFIPPENAPAFLLASANSDTSRSERFAEASSVGPSSCFSRPKNCKCSFAVKSSTAHYPNKEHKTSYQTTPDNDSAHCIHKINSMMRNKESLLESLQIMHSCCCMEMQRAKLMKFDTATLEAKCSMSHRSS